jgi:hypothetical protein
MFEKPELQENCVSPFFHISSSLSRRSTDVKGKRRNEINRHTIVVAVLTAVIVRRSLAISIPHPPEVSGIDNALGCWRSGVSAGVKTQCFRSTCADRGASG